MDESNQRSMHVARLAKQETHGHMGRQEELEALTETGSDETSQKVLHKSEKCPTIYEKTR